MTLEVGGEGWEGKSGVAGNRAIKSPFAKNCHFNTIVRHSLSKMGLTGLHDSLARVQNSLFIVWL